MKLPLWRAVLGFGVLAALVTVLVSLAPLYIDDYRLRGFMKSVVAQPVSDEAMCEQVAARARELSLPVQASDVHVSHPEGRRKLEARYIVNKDLALYEVDLHFHPQAER